MDYTKLKQLRKDMGLKNVSELIVLSQESDPFYVPGVENHREKAEWFAKQCQVCGFQKGWHLRTIHYKLSQVVKPLKPDGTVYSNTYVDWNFLQKGARGARYLDLIDPCDFVDKRNETPQIYAGGVAPEHLESADVDMPYWTLPEIDKDLSVSLRSPYALTDGYDYSESDQPYLIEVWIEKSTMDFVLEPLARELRFNLVVGKGFESITAVVEFLQRVDRTQKPTRIFYISDFDPNGDLMPTQISRQIEFWQPKYAPDSDIALMQLALTREQVDKYQLPRVPIKDKDNRKGTFEDIHGAGAVELDALEGVYPGELERIIREAIAPYRDSTLCERLEETAEDAQEEADSAWADIMEPYTEELEELNNAARAIAEKYQPQLSQLSEAMEAELAPIRERVQALRETVAEEAESFEVDIPGRPEAEAEGTDETDWLYRSDRDYMEQLTAYKARRNGHG